jgi:hypothetical protein
MHTLSASAHDPPRYPLLYSTGLGTGDPCLYSTTQFQSRDLKRVIPLIPAALQLILDLSLLN